MSEKAIQEKLIDKDKLAELLDANLAFIVKLAEAENVDDKDEEDLIKSIARIIEDTMAKTDRPEFLDYLDKSAVKHASDKGKKRLIAGIDAYTNKFIQQ